MKKFIILIFTNLTVASGLAMEPLDTMWLKITYHVSLKDFVEREKGRECNAVLEIGKTASSFYSPEYRRQVEVHDSLKALHVTGDVYFQKMFAINGFNKIMTYAVYKNFPTEGSLTYTDEIFGYNYTYKEDIPSIKWELIEGDTIICNYSCKKALGKLRGRTWITWYTLDIPISEGPWKLQGLPGLILYASDSQKDFTFSCLGVKKENRLICFWGNNLNKCTPIELQKELKDYWYDQSGYVNRREGLPKPDLSGLKVKVRPKKPCYIEFYEE